ncbi:STAS domain-containing protein [Mycolicibacterium litorale]|uniref:STAS domain-containing protein n=1 Tax=Mycolicibacterium litorale TaxID=758802 RepID=A0AAD1IWA1_9MYCO|nr:STAS domain-containing protein [Mycolicibacterium litorale]MCV7417731.1 STAS domain-containing protein [Mycolicibacterium litorale]TDY06879.1 anti-anti-sigma factor [Mycolicibacterium litorale]BBY18963.1 hypothetical protein MLIT_45550 [Mycolicibacterium litorale]
MTSSPVDHAVEQDDPPLTQTATVLNVRGDVDGSIVDVLRDTVRPLLGSGHRLVLDMSDVGFLGAAGIRFLLEVARDCRETGQPWAVVTGGAARRLLRAVGADRAIPAVDSIAEALRAARVADGDPHHSMPVVARDKVRC